MHRSKPYPHRGKFRCRVTTAGGSRWAPVGETREKAIEWAELALTTAQHNGGLTVSEAAEEYTAARLTDGVRSTSIRRYTMALRRLLGPVWSRSINELRPTRAQDLYDALRTTPGERGHLLSPDTHRTDLIIGKHFATWLVERGLLKINAFAAVKGVGRRNKGKPQPRIDEARKLHAVCLQDPGEGATAVLLLMWTAARSAELMSRTVRDVDDDGAVLCIEDDRERGWRTKSTSSQRRAEIPEYLRPRVLGLCKGKIGNALLWSNNGALHHHSWLPRQLHTLCERAGIPKFCPHALRGWNATAQARAGVDQRAIAEALGHSGTGALGHYVEPGNERPMSQLARVLKFPR